MMRALSGALAAWFCASCATASDSQPSNPAPGSGGSGPASTTEGRRLLAFAEEVFDRRLARHPMLQTYLGIKDDYGRWDDVSEAFVAEEHEIQRAQLDRLRSFDVQAMSPDERLNHELLAHELRLDIDGHRWRDHGYPLHQMYGWHSGVVAFLINQHRVETLEDARAYISRLNGIDELFAQVEAQLDRQLERGIVAPAFVFPMVRDDAKNVVTGRPFDRSDIDSPLLADFRKKVAGLELDGEASRSLLDAAVAALEQSVAPAYASLMRAVARHEAAATTDDGVWKLPEGSDFYAYRLRRITTTDLDADAIHELGRSEVSRIHGQMRRIMKVVGFEGTLSEFFEYMRTNERFYLSNDAEGRQAYLERAQARLDAMKKLLPQWFGRLPKAPMRVKRVEAFREKSAGKAFYSSPTPDGSRPGTYYVNLYDMSDMPTYQLEALAYHEGLPGHHLQIAIAQELEGLPRFRRFARYTAYSEGWGLYAEFLPKEMGMYDDPHSDFGRLSMELWRACRLVVDTGIHAKRWTREEAIEYLLENTPNPRGDVVKAIERYIVMPGQATAYKIGMLKILELRRRAKNAPRYDVRAFHDFVLEGGPMPLTILESRFEDWLEARVSAEPAARLRSARATR